MKKIINIIKYIIPVISIIFSILLLGNIFKLNIVPVKYILLGIIVLVVLNFITFLCMCSKKVWINIISLILSLALIIGSVIGIKYVKATDNFLVKTFNNNKMETTKYDIVVLKGKYKDISELRYKKIGYMPISNEVKEKVSEVISLGETAFTDILNLYKSLLNGDISAMLIDEAYLDVLDEEYDDINEKIEVLYTFDINTEIKNNQDEISIRPINIFISGSDSRTGVVYNKSRSDVNMILTVNPNTHEILTTSIPRDYYVQVHGQTGLKDKLTHAGIYGLDTSAKTIEDLFNIKIDYSIKVNFTGVKSIVDLIGGINVYSDITFNSFHLRGWTVEKGMNYMDGRKALAYARERYAYKGGDRHRILNQQQVFIAVFEKISQDKSLLLKYEDLLNEFSKLYYTNIPSELIKLYIKEQLNKMPKWKFITNSVDGSNLMTATYTAPNSLRYVMVPYEKDVQEAHDQIMNLLSK